MKERSLNRLSQYDYNRNGAYFIIMCVEGRKQILSRIIVGTGVLDCPKIELTQQGEIAEKYLHQLNDFYRTISVDCYVIMPDHIHLILTISNGQSGTPVPTKSDEKTNAKNSTVSQFISTFKRFCNKEYGINIWQRSFCDHVIRNEQDYQEAYTYIQHNPTRWVDQHKGA